MIDPSQISPERYGSYFTAFNLALPLQIDRFRVAERLALPAEDNVLPIIHDSHAAMAAFWADEPSGRQHIGVSLFALKEIVDKHVGQSVVVFEEGSAATLRPEDGSEKDDQEFKPAVTIQTGTILGTRNKGSIEGRLWYGYSGSDPVDYSLEANASEQASRLQAIGDNHEDDLSRLGVPRPWLELSVGVLVTNRQAVRVSGYGRAAATGITAPDAINKLIIFKGDVSLFHHKDLEELRGYSLDTYDLFRRWQQKDTAFGNEAALAVLSRLAAMEHHKASQKLEALDLTKSQPLPDLTAIFPRRVK